MKRIAVVLALVALGACQKKAEQTPAQAADTSHKMMADTSKAMMADTSHMMMADTSKKMAAPAAPAAKPAPKKKP
jgi:hypothetical protein